MYARIAAHEFGSPMLDDAPLELMAKALVAERLGMGWTWCHRQGLGWDFERSDGLRVVVESDATLRSWNDFENDPSMISAFDCSAGTRGRLAHGYIFAWHGMIDLDSADHRDRAQWRYFVVPTPTVNERMGDPGVRMVILDFVQDMARSRRGVTWDGLLDEVNSVVPPVLSSDKHSNV